MRPWPSSIGLFVAAVLAQQFRDVLVALFRGSCMPRPAKVGVLGVVRSHENQARVFLEQRHGFFQVAFHNRLMQGVETLHAGFRFAGRQASLLGLDAAYSWPPCWRSNRENSSPLPAAPDAEASILSPVSFRE